MCLSRVSGISRTEATAEYSIARDYDGGAAIHRPRASCQSRITFPELALGSAAEQAIGDRMTLLGNKIRARSSQSDSARTHLPVAASICVECVAMNKREFSEDIRHGPYQHTASRDLRRLTRDDGPLSTNWAGNLTYHTSRRCSLPRRLVRETQQIVKSTPKLRALGSKHSFNAIADSNRRADLAAASGQHGIGHGRPQTRPEPSPLARASATVRSRHTSMQAGLRAAQSRLAAAHHGGRERLRQATHGSGVTNGNLSTAVAGARDREG